MLLVEVSEMEKRHLYVRSLVELFSVRPRDGGPIAGERVFMAALGSTVVGKRKVREIFVYCIDRRDNGKGSELLIYQTCVFTANALNKQLQHTMRTSKHRTLILRRIILHQL